MCIFSLSLLLAGIVEDIKIAITCVDETLKREVEGSYIDYQANTYNRCKALAKNAHEMVLRLSSSPGDMASTSRDLTTTYSQLVDNVCDSLATIESNDMAQRLRKTVHNLGDGCNEIVHCAANVQGNPDNQPAKRDLADTARVVTEKVSHVVSAIQAGGIGTQAFNEAITSINSITGDLETTAMFAATGVLNEVGDGDTSFSEHRVNILETAKKLVEDIKHLVSSAAGSQEALVDAAINIVKTITNEVEYVKLGAAALSSDDMEAQLLLLTAAKDVANALGDLIGSTRMVFGKSVQDPAIEALKSSAKVSGGASAKCAVVKIMV